MRTKLIYVSDCGVVLDAESGNPVICPFRGGDVTCSADCAACACGPYSCNPAHADFVRDVIGVAYCNAMPNRSSIGLIKRKTEKIEDAIEKGE